MNCTLVRCNSASRPANLATVILFQSTLITNQMNTVQQPSVSLQMVNSHTQVDQILVEIWRTDRGVDQEPEIATDASEGVTALSTSKMSWLSVSEDGDVRLYDASQSDLQGIVTNAAGVGVRSVAVDPRVNVSLLLRSMSVQYFREDFHFLTHLS